MTSMNAKVCACCEHFSGTTPLKTMYGFEVRRFLYVRCEAFDNAFWKNTEIIKWRDMIAPSACERLDELASMNALEEL